MPRFPCSRFLRYSRYCTGSGRSRPYWWPEGRHRGRVADGALAEVGGGRVTGHQVGDHERDQRDADQQHHAGAEPLQQEAAQVAVPAPATGGVREPAPRQPWR